MVPGTLSAGPQRDQASVEKPETKGSVLLVGTFPSSARAKRGVCAELASRLSDAGWSVLTASAKPGRVARLIDMLHSVWHRRHEYAVAQVDVFSGPAFLWAEAACWTLRRARKPYILTLHGGNLPAFSRRWPGRVRRLLRSAVQVTAPSGYLGEQMRAYCERLRVLPNALDLRAYPFQARVHPQPRLVWLRSFHAIYNPSLAPKVVARLASRFPEIQLTMIGPDQKDGSWEHTQRIAQEMGVSDRIRLPGGVPKAEIGSWLDTADIFLNTASIDNTPVSVLEAMACGLCVVSTDVGGLPYLLKHEHDALLVPPDDVDAMSAAIRRLLTEPGLAKKLSCHAREKAEAFDWSGMLPQWQSLLRAAIESARP